MPATRVLIVDDHPLVRSGLRSLLERTGEFEVVGEGADGYEAVELAALHAPDVILLDVAMPRLNGADAAQYIRDKVPLAGVIMLSMHANKSYVPARTEERRPRLSAQASPESEVLSAIARSPPDRLISVRRL